ncbi:esterase/lipase family protein [Gordonia phthalatica]|uniref:Lipase n=1 Tax=Gordonia phthalatica TaxID=1136941 RepID=A0A0N7FU67_9ACTN|nr:alpha/beta fold hydrolase [Gordonia phthalatica]ALG83511.1 lipase [Gordonia phthalatica]
MKHIGRLIVTLCAVLLGVLTVVAPAQADPKLPENYNFFGGIPYELQHPGGSLPGSNDFSCKPTAEHPRPVVLVHGTGGAKTTNWGSYVPMLKNRGYCVFALTYGALPGLPWPFTAVGGMDRIQVSAAQLAKFVKRVRAATGAKTVDLIGHSQGTYMPTYYLKYLGGADKVTNYISLAPLWKGTGSLTPQMSELGRLLGDVPMPMCIGCGGMLPGSSMNKKIWRGGSPYVKGVKYTNIMTRYDEAVVPYTAGYVRARKGEQVKNIVVQDTCSQDYSDHMAIAGSRRAAYFALNALDPAHPVTVPCEFVPPFTGQS